MFFVPLLTNLTRVLARIYAFANVTTRSIPSQNTLRMTARGGLVRSDSADRLRADATRDVQLTGSWLSLITSSLPLSSFKTSLLATAKEQVSGHLASLLSLRFGRAACLSA